MTVLESIALVVTIASIFAYANHRWLGLPPAVGLMAMALVASLLLLGIDKMGWLPLKRIAGDLLAGIDFNEALMHGMLGALLFAGALHVKIGELRSHAAAVFGLAAGGTLLSTFAVGALFWKASALIGPSLTFGHALLFGALISPTDPVAVLGILKRVGVSKTLETQIAGESLFNDGVGIVVFGTILGVVGPDGHAADAAGIISLFAREAIGGVLFGATLGWVAYRLMRTIDHYQTELLITLALVLGGYSLAEHLHISAPLAAVASGLVVGNKGRALGMSDETRDYLDKFWELTDEILNAFLFVLMGMELVRIAIPGHALLLAIATIPIVLAARATSVALLTALMRRFASFERGSWTILTWGGLRGGISVALALSVPHSGERDVIVIATYVVVVFSILVQGLTLAPLARRHAAKMAEAERAVA